MFASLRRCQQVASTATASLKQHPRPAYFIQRNSNGNLPVYTDIRNAGSRHLVEIRNVEGDAATLAKEISLSLFEPDTYEAQKLKVRTNHQHVIVSGGRWKQEVLEWLKTKGF
ncbi:mitochondrial large subunit ribosomal protein-domain-containing protein [Coprinopsis sp. MPI-PUGE-AT-0042]|nr:mitochondrial large subunit ribosomal protein-domain-containing protein [Coprinopsis sp. MPI-PUGE-AT-0042]